MYAVVERNLCVYVGFSRFYTMCIHCSQPQGVRQLEGNVNHDLAYFPIRMLVAAARTQRMVWTHNSVASGRTCMLLSLDMDPSPLLP